MGSSELVKVRQAKSTADNVFNCITLRWVHHHACLTKDQIFQGIAQFCRNSFIVLHGASVSGDIGTIYTQRSGKQRFLAIELCLDEWATIAETARLQARMQSHLDEHFTGMVFYLIPLPHVVALPEELVGG